MQLGNFLICLFFIVGGALTGADSVYTVTNEQLEVMRYWTNEELYYFLTLVQQFPTRVQFASLQPLSELVRKTAKPAVEQFTFKEQADIDDQKSLLAMVDVTASFKRPNLFHDYVSFVKNNNDTFQSTKSFFSDELAVIKTKLDDYVQTHLFSLLDASYGIFSTTRTSDKGEILEFAKPIEKDSAFATFLKSAAVYKETDQAVLYHAQSNVLSQTGGATCGYYAAYNAGNFVAGACGDLFDIKNESTCASLGREQNILISVVQNLIKKHFEKYKHNIFVNGVVTDTAYRNEFVKSVQIALQGINKAKSDYARYACAFIFNLGGHWISVGVYIDCTTASTVKSLRLYVMDSFGSSVPPCANILFEALTTPGWVERHQQPSLTFTALQKEQFEQQKQRKVQLAQLMAYADRLKNDVYKKTNASLYLQRYFSSLFDTDLLGQKREALYLSFIRYLQDHQTQLSEGEIEKMRCALLWINIFQKIDSLVQLYTGVKINEQNALENYRSLQGLCKQVGLETSTVTALNKQVVQNVYDQIIAKLRELKILSV